MTRLLKSWGWFTKSGSGVRVTIRGPGVVCVNSADLVNSESFKRMVAQARIIKDAEEAKRAKRSAA